MGLKLFSRDSGAPVEKQIADVHRNLEIIAKEIDAVMNRIRQLEADGLPGGLLMYEE